MSFSPRMEVDLDKIKCNEAKIVELCHGEGISVLGDPRIRKDRIWLN